MMQQIMESRMHALTHSILKAKTDKQVERLLNSFIHENFFVTAKGKPKENQRQSPLSKGK
jgi:hypothetical protein